MGGVFVFAFVPVAEPGAARQCALIEALVKKIQKYRLEVPAVFLGEAMKPMSPAAIWQNEDDWQQVAFIPYLSPNGGERRRGRQSCRRATHHAPWHDLVYLCSPARRSVH